MNLTNKNILISGANRGIGLALAKKAAQEGLSIHALCRTQDANLKKELLALGANDVTLWDLDLSKKESIDQFIQTVKKSKLSVDLLINNAGLLTGGLLEEQSIEEIRNMLHVNLTGLIQLTHGLLPEMLKLDEAKIVNNASVMGKAFIPCGSTYSASKAGVVAFTDCLKHELRPTNVSTLLLLTPAVKTDLFTEVEKTYSPKLDLSLVKPITAEKWASRVFEHIKKDKAACWPTGFNKLEVKMAHHFPTLTSISMKHLFKR